MARLIYGVHPVEEALRRRGREVEGLLVARRSLAPEVLAAAEARRIPIQRSSPAELDALCGTTSHQGVAAVVGDFPYLDLEDLLERSGEAAPLFTVLDSVTDPQNLGAIIRSSVVLGATALVLPKDRAAPITPTVVRVSAGASEHLPCARVTNLARALRQMQEAGLWIAGAVEAGGIPPAEVDLTAATALVLGNEQKGIRPLIRRGCDVLVTIPSCSRLAALNVAAAATALLYEASRQRARPRSAAGPTSGS